MQVAQLIIFISGRGSNMEAIIKQIDNGILKNKAKIALVFSNNPDAKGLDIAKQHNIPTFSLNSVGIKREAYDKQVVELLNNYTFDYIILAGYMRILSPILIRAFQDKIINIHPADTRQHQGLHAYEWAFKNKLDKTYITIHKVNEGVDTGEILAQYPVDISDCSTLEEVETKGLAVEHRAYSEIILKLITK